MKYLALLNDSFREAMDSKVLYLTAALSVLLLAFVGSTYFHPMTAEDQAKAFTYFFDEEARWANQFRDEGRPTYKLLDAKLLNDATEPWNQKYRLLIKVSAPVEFANSMQGIQKRLMFDGLLHNQFQWMKNLKIDKETSFFPLEPKQADTKPKKANKKKDGKDATKKKGQQPANDKGPNDEAKVDIQDDQPPKAEKLQIILYTITHDGSKLDGPRHWMHDPQLFFGLMPASSIPLFGYVCIAPLNYAIYNLERALVSAIGGNVIILIGLIVTAGFVPNMMQKGTVDLLISKPVSRSALLIFKYFGGLFFVLFNSVLAIGGVWLLFGIKTGIWTYGFPLTALVITFYFAILYSVSVLFGVISRNALICILLACIFWILLFAIGIGHSRIYPSNQTKTEFTEQGIKRVPVKQQKRGTANLLVQAFDVVYFVLPRTNDLGNLTTELLSQELLTKEEMERYDISNQNKKSYWESAGVSVAFIAVMLALACLRFHNRDY